MTEEKKAQLRDRLRESVLRSFKVERRPRNRTKRKTRRASSLLGSSPEPSPCALEDGLTNGTGLEINKREAGESRAFSKGCLEEKKGGGFKRKYFEELEKAACSTSCGSREEEIEEEQEGEERKGQRCEEAQFDAVQDPYQGSDPKKKKKKRKRLKNGVIETCSDSSSKSSDESERMSSDEDLEAPVKKKSRDHPGSVLALLTSHVREQLEQGAAVDLPNDDGGVTSGVKVVTYFNLHLKPQYGQFQRELREMFTLASTLDQLRAGDIARVGDSLAGRFMALHQFLQDGHWGTAKHMELHPLEESSAAGPSIVLASRKHAKLVQKVQGVVSQWSMGISPRERTRPRTWRLVRRWKRRWEERPPKEKERREKDVGASGRDTMPTLQIGRRTKTRRRTRSRGWFGKY